MLSPNTCRRKHYWNVACSPPPLLLNIKPCVGRIFFRLVDKHFTQLHRYRHDIRVSPSIKSIWVKPLGHEQRGDAHAGTTTDDQWKAWAKRTESFIRWYLTLLAAGIPLLMIMLIIITTATTITLTTAPTMTMVITSMETPTRTTTTPTLPLTISPHQNYWRNTRITNNRNSRDNSNNRIDYSSIRKYIGCSKNTFKQHTSSFRISEICYATSLTSQVWHLKDKGIIHIIKRKILKKLKSLHHWEQTLQVLHSTVDEDIKELARSGEYFKFRTEIFRSCLHFGQFLPKSRDLQTDWEDSR